MATLPSGSHAANIYREEVEAGLPGRLFHDYRRTAVRDLTRAGVPRSIAKTMTGHKTDAVFERYNITNNADKRKAQADLARYRNNTIATQSASR